VIVGEELETPGLTLTEAHAALYRALTGEPAGDRTALPDLLALCVSIGLGWRIPKKPLAVIAFLTLDWQSFQLPRAGDTVHAVSRNVVKRPMREGGILVQERDLVDHRGTLLQRGRFTFLVARRPPEPSC
jgi:hypothetical protein